MSTEVDKKAAAEPKQQKTEELGKSKHTPPPATIPEEGHPSNDAPVTSQGGRAGVSGRSNNRYNNRRKSTDLSGLGAQQEKKTNKPRFFNNSQGRQKSFESNVQQNQPQHQEGATAKDRRQAYNKQRSNSHRNFHSSEQAHHKSGEGANLVDNRERNNKSRSMSSTQMEANGDANVEGESAQKKRANRGSTTSNGKSNRIGSSSINSNGESFDYDDLELDEPFSDSDEDTPRHRQVQKPCLIIPRGRIRTLSGTVPPVGSSPKWGGPTMCLSCLQFFNLPDEIGKFADHLLDEHRIVIEDVALIVDPKRYVEHWRQRFAKTSVDKVFPKIVPDESDPYFGKADYYFEMSDRLPEDYSVRQRLAMRRLEEALACQQREREEVTFSMQCIFCRYIARGNRSKMIHHLYMIHHLNLGSPDNLVFVSEYVEHLKEKLQRNECIYCEKTFSDRSVLMDHMRKRNHREVNPKNNYYDRFYIINYLELGKRWLDVLAEDFEDTMPTFVDSDDEEEEESWHEWQEDNTDEDQLRVVCLFCDRSSDKVVELLDHMKEQHTFDLNDFVEKEKLDLYGRMKFLNFVRKQTFNTPNFRARSRNSCSSVPSGGRSSSTNDTNCAENDQDSKKENSESDSSVATLPAREQWDMEENLVPMFGNDHLPWMYESYLEEKQTNDLAEDQQPGAIRKSKSTMSESADAVDPEVMKAAVKSYIDECKKNTVEEVTAEDWPDLGQSVLADPQVGASLR
ncbi:c2H2 type zinc-finger (2 copies) domain-containing protein [Ditylenchus destructor]|uniref:C2H2 type zinc-finger (2 copies) domain-containing protein n=1 Tax=Ditylenchus destructor TaxID=166010 RepID=A0AAD4NAW6_9BILA|nr:c2H2 type zinc-finger (2 copies) domain-containing protein [Ditylenchus destructor]